MFTTCRIFWSSAPRFQSSSAAKVVLDLHDPMPELMETIFGMPEGSFGVRLLKHLEKLSVGFADLVITVNLACKRIYSSRGCRPDKIAVVMNAPEDQVFRFQRPSPADANGSGPARPFSLMYHGSLVPRNGFDLAVDALEIARQRIPHLKLMVCGEANAYFEEVMKSAEERGLAESVQYLRAERPTGNRGVDQSLRPWGGSESSQQLY